MTTWDSGCLTRQLTRQRLPIVQVECLERPKGSGRVVSKVPSTYGPFDDAHARELVSATVDSSGVHACDYGRTSQMALYYLSSGWKDKANDQIDQLTKPIYRFNPTFFRSVYVSVGDMCISSLLCVGFDRS